MSRIKREKPDRAEQVEPVPDQINSDQIGAYPSRYDTDALPERRTAAYARMVTIIATVEGFAIIALSLAIATLLPLQKVVPMVVTSNDRGDEIVHINPASLDSPTVDYVAEISLRDYIKKRYSIVASAAEQGINWGQGSTVQLMSDPEVFKVFMDKAKPEYDRLHAQNMVRDVRIDSVRKLDQGTWQVEFITNDHPFENVMGGPVSGETRSWVTTLDLTYEPKNVTYNQRLNNPFGVTITSVNDARRD